MSLIKANAVQIGQSPTATENFTLAVPSSPDGTIKLARGNAGATTQDVLSVDASGNVNGLVKSTGSSAARSLANRFADVVNVLDYGAFNDGTNAAATTTAIQNAVNYGSYIVFPYGTYTISSDITIAANKTLIINGIINRTGSGSISAFVIQGSNVEIKGGGEIRGPQYGGTISYVADQNAIENPVDTTLSTKLKNIKISDLNISGWGDAAIEMWDIDNLLCDNLTLHDIGRIGILAITGKNITYSNNYVYDIGPGGGGVAPFINAYGMSASSDTGTIVPASKNIKIHGNTVIGIEHWEAYDLHGVDGAIISNNTAIDCMIGIYVGASTGTNNLNTNNVVVSNNYLNNVNSQYSRSGILVGPSYGAGQYGDNIAICDNNIVGHGLSQATIDAGFTSTDGEGAIHVVRTRNCLVDSNNISLPYNSGILVRVQNLGTTISNNRVDSPVPSNGGQSSCFKGTDSNECIVSVNNNVFQRLQGTSDAVTIQGTPDATYGYRYSETNQHIGNFTNIFNGSSYSLLHNTSSYLTKVLAAGRISLTSGGATLTQGFNITSVSRTVQGVVRVTINIDAINANYYVSVTPDSGSFASATYNTPAVGTIDFLMWNSTTTLVDIPFSFEIRGSAF